MSTALVAAIKELTQAKQRTPGAPSLAGTSSGKGKIAIAGQSLSTPDEAILRRDRHIDMGDYSIADVGLVRATGRVMRKTIAGAYHLELDQAELFHLTVATTGTTASKIVFPQPPAISAVHSGTAYGGLAVFRPLHIWLSYSGEQKPKRLVTFEGAIWEGGVAPILSTAAGAIDAFYFEHFGQTNGNSPGPWLGNAKGTGYR